MVRPWHSPDLCDVRERFVPEAFVPMHTHQEYARYLACTVGKSWTTWLSVLTTMCCLTIFFLIIADFAVLFGFWLPVVVCLTTKICVVLAMAIVARFRPDNQQLGIAMLCLALVEVVMVNPLKLIELCDLEELSLQSDDLVTLHLFRVVLPFSFISCYVLLSAPICNLHRVFLLAFFLFVDFLSSLVDHFVLDMRLCFPFSTVFVFLLGSLCIVSTWRNEVILQQHFLEVQALVNEVKHAWEKAQVVARKVKKEKRIAKRSVWQCQQNFLLDAIFDCTDLAHVDLDDNMHSFKWNELIKSVVQVLDALRIISSNAIQWSVSPGLPKMLKAHKFRISRLVLYLATKCWVVFESIRVDVKQLDDDQISALRLKQKKGGNLIVKEIFVLIQVRAKDKEPRSGFGEVDLSYATNLAKSIGGDAWVERNEKKDPKAFNVVIPCVSSKFINGDDSDESSFSDDSDSDTYSEVVSEMLNPDENMEAFGKVFSNATSASFGKVFSNATSASNFGKVLSNGTSASIRQSQESFGKVLSNGTSASTKIDEKSPLKRRSSNQSIKSQKSDKKAPPSYVAKRRISDPLVPAKQRQGSKDPLPRYKLEEEFDLINPRIAGKCPKAPETRKTEAQSSSHGKVRASSKDTPSRKSYPSFTASSFGSLDSGPVSSLGSIDTPVNPIKGNGRNNGDESPCSSGFGLLEDLDAIYSAPELQREKDSLIPFGQVRSADHKFRPLFSQPVEPITGSITGSTEGSARIKSELKHVEPLTGSTLASTDSEASVQIKYQLKPVENNPDTLTLNTCNSEISTSEFNEDGDGLNAVG